VEKGRWHIEMVLGRAKWQVAWLAVGSHPTEAALVEFFL
jgi:hypothetical protein